MPIDTRELRRSKNAAYELITTDRLCDQCRYNLKGLPSNGKCPECGRPIRGRRSKRFVDSMVDAPAFYLKTLTLGIVVMAVFSIVSAFAFSAVKGGLSLIAVGVAGAGSLGWWLGVYITTAPRVFSETMTRDELLDSNWLRMTNRGMQAAWMVSAVAWLLAIRGTGPAAQFAELGARGAELIGLFGLAPLAVQLSSLANWAGDTGLSERFKISAWLMGFCGIFAAVGALVAGFGSPLRGLITLRAGIAGFGWSIGQLILLYSLAQLAYLAMWAIRNQSTAAAADRRLRLKEAKHEREMADRTAAAAAMLDSAKKAKPSGPAKSALDKNIIARPGGAGPGAPGPSKQKP